MKESFRQRKKLWERVRKAKSRNSKEKAYVLTGECRPAPEHLEEDFKTRLQVLYVNDCLRDGLRTLQIFDMEGLAFDVDVQKVTGLINDAIQEMHFGLPWKECDCAAFTECEKCGGRRWLSLRQANTLGLTYEDGSRSSVSQRSRKHIESELPVVTSTPGDSNTPLLPEAT